MGGKVVWRKHIIYFSCGWESRLSYLVTLDALLTQQEEKKKKKERMNKCLQQKEAALWFSGKTGTGLSGG